jgi:hypothetical protein
MYYESILPDDIARQVLTLGKGLASPRTELVLPYAQALQAIVIATAHKVAILFLEAFEAHHLGENHGYIFTSASERAFASLTNRTK